MMENRKHYASPRDRIDPAFLAEILGEGEPSCGCYGTEDIRPHAADRRTGPEHAVGRNNGCRPHERVRPRQESGPRPETNENSGNACGSCAKPSPLNGMALAMVYAPDHDWDGLYDAEEALSHGTLFQALDLPFYCGCGGNCR